MKQMKLILVMIIWGSVGLFSKSIPLTPVMLAFCRALISLPVLFFYTGHIVEKHTHAETVPFLISGALIGLAWCALFQSFAYSGIAVGILTYNMCPVYVMLLAPRLLNEKLQKIHIVQVSTAIMGLVMIVAGSLNKGAIALGGIGFGILSGLLYAIIVIMNRRNQKSTVSLGRATRLQMTGACLVLLPIVLFQDPVQQISGLDARQVVLLLMLGIIHTGIAYLIYFSTYVSLSAIKVALISYLEPVFGILFGWLILAEKMDLWKAAGGVLILGAMIAGEVFKKSNRFSFML